MGLPAVADRFPGLARARDGRRVVFADAPGGTQVPATVIQAMAGYLGERNANTGGAFETSRLTDGLIADARRAGADLLGCDADEVVFGPNTTSLAFALSRSLAREIDGDDEIVLTVLDHDANVAPWLAIASERGARVRMVDVTSDGRLDVDSFQRALGPRTGLVAFTLASNALGTVTPAAEIVGLVRDRAPSAIVIADGVHLAPHRLIAARGIGADVVFTSAYKYFGPHLGVMYGRRDALATWRPYRVRPAPETVPERWETGTLPHESLAGFVVAVEYLAGLGGGAASRRDALAAAFAEIAAHEAAISTRFLEGLPDGVRLFGPSSPDERTPTFAVRLGDEPPRRTAEALAARGVFAWDGDYYAMEIMRRLGLADTGGAVRVGFCHYNTLEEVDRVLSDLVELSGRGRAQI